MKAKLIEITEHDLRIINLLVGVAAGEKEAKAIMDKPAFFVAGFSTLEKFSDMYDAMKSGNTGDFYDVPDFDATAELEKAKKFALESK